MKNLVRIIFFITFLSTCSSPKEQLVQQQLFTFGTLVDISIWTKEIDKAQKIIQKISSDFERQHQQWHPNHKNSLLAKLNNDLAVQKKVSIDPSLFELVTLATQFSKQSDELFNPAIGKLVDLWHFDQLIDPAIKEIKPPRFDEISPLLRKKPSMNQLYLDKSLKQISTTNTAIKLDFGAFAKGYAVEYAIKTLQYAGFKSALVNAGGDIKGIGRKGGKAWKVGIRNPFYQQQVNQPVIASITLKDNESIMTSGDYERFFVFKNKNYHHMIDPRTGYPAQGFHSVTVVHDNATLADAAATALFIAGPKKWQKIARQMGINKVMLISQAGELIISQQLKSRLRIIPNKKLKTIVVNLD